MECLLCSSPGGWRTHPCYARFLQGAWLQGAKLSQGPVRSQRFGRACTSKQLKLLFHQISAASSLASEIWGLTMLMGSHLSLDNMVLFTECRETGNKKCSWHRKWTVEGLQRQALHWQTLQLPWALKKKVSLFGAVERNNKFNKCYLHTAVKKEGGFLKLCVNKESTLSLFKCSWKLDLLQPLSYDDRGFIIVLLIHLSWKSDWALA